MLGKSQNDDTWQGPARQGSITGSRSRGSREFARETDKTDAQPSSQGLHAEALDIAESGRRSELNEGTVLPRGPAAAYGVAVSTSDVNEYRRDVVESFRDPRRRRHSTTR